MKLYNPQVKEVHLNTILRRIVQKTELSIRGAVRNAMFSEEEHLSVKV
jgi:hypothetical protein